MFTILNQKVDYPLHFLLGFDFNDLPLKSLYKLSDEPSLTLISALYTESGSQLAISELDKKIGKSAASKRLSEHANKLEALLLKHDIQKEIKYTLEHKLDDDFHQVVKKDNLMTLNDRHIFLNNKIEITATDINSYIFNFQMKNLVPVFVFPEKSQLNLQAKRLGRLFDRGTVFQIDWLSLVGFHGNDAQRTAIQLLEMKAVKFVGFPGINLFQVFKKNGCRIPKKVSNLLDEQLFV